MKKEMSEDKIVQMAGETQRNECSLGRYKSHQVLFWVRVAGRRRTLESHLLNSAVWPSVITL